MSPAGRDRITAAELSAATRTAVDVAMRQVDRLTAEMTLVREQIHAIGRRQPACRALQAAHYGIGPLTSVVIWAEMGDTRRFRSSDDAVRHAGLDVTVYSSDGRRSEYGERGHQFGRLDAPGRGPAQFGGQRIDHP